MNKRRNKIIGIKKIIGSILCLAIVIGLVPHMDMKAADPTSTSINNESYVGDIDGDGTITPKDVTKLRRFLAGGWDVEIETEDADVDGDGKVTPKDVTMLRRYLAGGWGISLPIKNAASNHEGIFNVSYTEAYYTITEHDSSGRISKEYNYYFGPNSGVIVYSYGTDGSMTSTSKGRITKNIYDSKGNLISNTVTFQGKAISSTEYKTAVNGTVTTVTRERKLQDGLADETVITETENERTIKNTTKNKNGNIIRSTAYKYDSDGKMIEMLTYTGAYDKTTITEYTYDGNGRISKETYKDEEGNITGLAEMVYDANGNLIKETQKNKSGKISGYIEYEYDTKGRKIKELSKDKFDRIISTYEYEYDAKDRVTKEVYKETKEPNGYIYETEYFSDTDTDEEENIKKRVEKTQKGKVTRLYEYDTKHRLIKDYEEDYQHYDYLYDDSANSVTITDTSSDEQNVYIYSFDDSTRTMYYTGPEYIADHMDVQYGTAEYDENAKLVKITYYDSSKKLESICEYIYDANDVVLKSASKNTDQVPGGSTVYKYNEYGSRTEIIGYDQNEEERYRGTFEYFANGKIKKISNTNITSYDIRTTYTEHDDTGRVIASGNIKGGVDTYSFKREFNEYGRCIKELFSYGSNSRTYDAYGRVAEYVQLDKDGNLKEKTIYEFNEEGQLVSENKTSDIFSELNYKTIYGYNEEGLRLSATKTDLNDNLISTTALEYDEYEQCCKAIKTDKDGVLSETITYIYDNVGRCIKEVYEYPDNSKNYTRINKFLEDGMDAGFTEEHADGTQVSTSLEYYEDGTLSKRSAISADGTKTEETYYENGVTKSYNRQNPDGASEDTVYYKNGNWKSRIIINAQGESYEETYDEKNRQTLWVKANNGKEEFRYSYAYHDNGECSEVILVQKNTKETTKYDDSGIMLSSEYIVYDDEGKEIYYVLKDGDGNIIEERGTKPEEAAESVPAVAEMVFNQDIPDLDGGYLYDCTISINFTAEDVAHVVDFDFYYKDDDNMYIGITEGTKSETDYADVVTSIDFTDVSSGPAMHATVDQNYLNVILMQFRNVKSVKYGYTALEHLPVEGLNDYYGNPLTILD